jgi:2-polyprenyl-6-hydroxyphenyl methylase/3-demethylubiquinone-9 3-methyltransferase
VTHMEADFAETKTSVDPAEVAKFERMAAEWWDPDGKFRPLHKLNPVRLAYIRDTVAAHFDRDARAPGALRGLRVLDIGCGGGLLSEPLTRLGATVVGIDPAPANIEVARLHAEQSGLAVDYRATSAEAIAAAGEVFDVTLAMEVVEHVPDIGTFLRVCAKLLHPGGLAFVATINRTLKAYALVIIGAEIVLRWLPRGTHDYAKLVRPAELESSLGAAGLTVIDRSGVSYNPISDSWRRSTDLDVNYMFAAEKRPAEPIA